MELGALFLFLAVLAVVILFVSGPFTENWRVQANTSHQISSLLAERDRILNALADLDFDQALGKIPAEAYPVQRASLLQTGALVLRQLDELQGAQPPEKHSVKVIGKSAKLFTDEELEDLIAKRRTARKTKAVGFCPKCGKPIVQSDLFCPSCGQPTNRS
jgi:hypothetical protein